MSEFKTTFKGEFIGRGSKGLFMWRLLGPLEYYSDVAERLIVVPTGFETDLASVFYKTYPLPPVLHDYCWSLKDMPRSLGNDVYLEAMNVVEDIAKWRRWVRYSVVSVAQYVRK